MLPKYTIGVGDRFGRQAGVQLDACIRARDFGIDISPVWNKSHREHTIIGSHPASVRAAADAAVRDREWTGAYFVDADHIRLDTVEMFAEACDFFTIDVADSIGQPPSPEALAEFCRRHNELTDTLNLPGVGGPISMMAAQVEAFAAKYLLAAQEAGRIYRRIVELKPGGRFAIEVSMDETSAPQCPAELLVILAAIADEEIPIQTIAPKFTGRFNKGVDYVGNVEVFEWECRDDIAVLAHAAHRYGLPANLKLSVHSGSDKFSLYGPIGRILRETGAGLHLKTAGTTWLEEVIGLSESGPEGLALAKEIYAQAFHKRDALCQPYATVIDIHPDRLPDPALVAGWSAEQFAGALRHDPADPRFNPDIRQLLHVGFKIAALMGESYLAAVDSCADVISANVTHNLLDRHIRPIFGGWKANEV